MEAFPLDHYSQPSLFSDIPDSVPPRAQLLWSAIGRHYANPRNFTPPTRKQLADLIHLVAPDAPYSKSTIDRILHDHREFFPVWPIQRGMRPPWQTGELRQAGERVGRLWQTPDYLISGVDDDWLELFGYLSRRDVVGQPVSTLVRHYPGPRPIQPYERRRIDVGVEFDRWADVAYLANGTPRRMMREAHLLADGGYETLYWLVEPRSGAIHTARADGCIHDVTPEWLHLLRFAHADDVIDRDSGLLLMHRVIDLSLIADLHTRDCMAFVGSTYLGDGSSRVLRREVWHATIASNTMDGFIVRFSEASKN